MNKEFVAVYDGDVSLDQVAHGWAPTYTRDITSNILQVEYLWYGIDEYTIFRSFLDFDISGIGYKPKITKVELILNTDSISGISLGVDIDSITATEKAEDVIGDADLFSYCKGTRYGQNINLTTIGDNTVDLGANAVADLQKRIGADNRNGWLSVGISLNAENTSKYVRFRSLEHATVATRPRLRITWQRGRIHGG